jgi:hypothetical protein
MGQEYELEVMIIAVVRVRAQNEREAREIIASTALGSPSVDEIRLANQAQFLAGKDAAIIDISFSVEEDSVKLIQIKGKSE